MDKNIILDALDELYDEVQWMRENGGTDLRTVLMHISSTQRKIRRELDK